MGALFESLSSNEACYISSCCLPRFLPYIGMVTIVMNDYPKFKVSFYNIRWNSFELPLYYKIFIVFSILFPVLCSGGSWSFCPLTSRVRKLGNRKIMIIYILVRHRCMCMRHTCMLDKGSWKALHFISGINTGPLHKSEL